MLGTATGIGLIMTLIQLYQREGDKRSSKNKDDFFEWLIEHKFLEIKSMIESHGELSAEIETLLHMNQEALLTRFDEVDSKLMCIMNSVQEFRGFVHAIDPKSGLSDQEESLLLQAVESGETTIIDNRDNTHRYDWSIDGKFLSVTNPRRIESDLINLASLGYLKESTSQQGRPKYTLLGMAFDYVDNIKSSDLSDQAVSILKQYIASDAQYLCTILNEVGQPLVQADNTPIAIESRRFVNDDLDSLDEHGFICFDGDMGTGKRYTLTREGDAFISNMGDGDG